MSAYVAAKIVSESHFLNDGLSLNCLNSSVWSDSSSITGVTLVATDAGLAAIGIEPDTSAAPEPAPKTRTPREGTKQAALIAMLRMPDGATIEEIMAATGWQSHTVRGAMAGALKKKLGLEVTSEKVEGRGRVYRIA
ncbi:DUF3489 domain-containing protein [Thioclava sp. GXIMD4215]|uniref:DUF3489 domain-containing protein n=1 Tax=Thioclava sp. GXIMD4215 TaxID=3131928 RepID=UPI003872CC47